MNCMPSRLSSLFSRLTLLQQLSLLVLISTVPLMVSALFMYNRLVDNERENVRLGLFVSAKTLASLIDNEIATHTALVSALAVSDTLQSGDLPAFLNQAKEALKATPGDWLAVSTPDGQQVANTLTEAGSALPKHVAPDVIRRGFAEGRAQIADLVFGPVAKRWTAYVEMPVFRDGNPLYSISITLAPERFLALLNENFTHGEIVAVLDRNGRFVTRMPDHAARVGSLATQAWRDAIAKRPDGFTENKTLEGTLAVNAYAQTASGWTAGVAVEEARLSQPVSDILRSSAVLAVLLTLASLAIGALIARHMSGNVDALAKAATDLGKGRPVIPPPVPFREAHIIATSLVAASDELQRRAEIIARSQAELEAKVAERTAALVDEIKRREASESTLRQSQKMESIGQLTGGIAHDFNNMLTIVMGNLDTALRRMKSLDGSAVLSRPLEAAMQGAHNAAKLTHRLLAFARQQPLEPAHLRIDTLIAGMADLITRTTGETIRVETVSSAGLWHVFIDPNQLENCVINLVINARDAMPDGGKLTIESANTYLDDAYVAQFTGVPTGQYVMLSVSDTGVGMPADVQERVFEPFFSTKEQGKGTGLGLAMVHGFVKQSGGHVRLYSELGVGTTIKIYLPRQLAAKPVVPDLSEVVPVLSAESRAKKGETVLVVEDDPAVRDYAIGALEDLGYRVLASAGGQEVLERFATAGRVTLLFTDVVLGGEMSGKQIADRLHEIDPKLPVIFTTGYTRNAIVHHGHLDPGVNLINKPYTQRDLAEKFRKVIDAADRGEG
jgi:signal transduction histidine kinase/CheY-like chemotaxis protein